MITLMTGIPRSGKTSHIVWMLVNDKHFKGRPIYTYGIPELKVEGVISLDGEPEKVMGWFDWAPVNAIIIVDECQFIFPARSPNSKAPEGVSKLTIHGHHGIDFILITQSPKLIDPLIRTLVGRHLHIKRSKLGFLKLLEFPECCDSPSSPASANLALISRYRKKKEVYKLYKSAEGHTKQTIKSSKLLYLLAFMLIFTPFMLYKSYASLSSSGKKEKPEKEETDIVTQTKDNINHVTNPNLDLPTTPERKVIGIEPTDYVARIPEKPETKPLYDNVRNVVNFEYPEVCISSKSKCKCYTNQATIIDEIPDAFCRKFAEDGVFNPYKPALNTSSNGTSGTSKNAT